MDDGDFLHDITLDVQENALTAVSVLNDILNYDKIESHTLSLEIDRVGLLSLLERTVQQFQVQALNGRVNLKFVSEEDRDWKDEESAAAMSCSSDP